MTKKKSKAVHLQELLYPEVEALGYEPVDLTFEKAGKDWVLTMYIDKDRGIGLDDCEFVSTRLSDVLDDNDPIEQSYMLTVSSPGIDRPLKTSRDFEKHLGKLININLFAPIGGKKQFQGVLENYDDDYIQLRLSTEEVIDFERKGVAKAVPEIEF